MQGFRDSEVVLVHGRQNRDQQVLATCFCGEQVAPVLARLGSPWCHECRDDADRRYRVLAESLRALSAERERRLAA